jgi:hypothetical protein
LDASAQALNDFNHISNGDDLALKNACISPIAGFDRSPIAGFDRLGTGFASF